MTETTYTPEGRPDVLSLGNNLQVNRDYYAWETPNGQGRLQSLQAGTSSNPTSLQNLSYTYDAVGNVATLTDAGETTNFTYDALNRLTDASGPYSQSYSYDAIGNIQTKDGLDYEYDAAHPHAVKDRKLNGVVQESYGYEANGNMINRAGDSLTYDAENRLESVTSGSETVSFTYDGDGRRALRDTVTETIAYAGPHYETRYTKTNKPEDLDDDCVVTVMDIMQVTAQWGQAGGPEDVNGDGIVDVADVQQVAGAWRATCHVLAGTTKYYTLGSQRIAMRKAGTLYYLFTDHLGSTSVTYNTTTGQTQTLRYYPWGEARSGDVPTDRRFTGQRWDATIELYDYQARYYDPALGRFTQPDPIVPEPGNPQALNRYSYVYNTPQSYSDPSGQCPAPPADVGSGNIICIAAFIPTEYSEAMPFGLYEFQGDNRGFSSDSPQDGSRFWMWIDAESGEILNPEGRPYVHSTCDKAGSCYAPRWDDNIFEVEKLDNGAIKLRYSVVCSHPLCYVAPGPEGEITFHPNEYGSYDTRGSVEPFPNLEAYHWLNGKLQNEYLFRRQNYSREELTRGVGNFWTSVGMYGMGGRNRDMWRSLRIKTDTGWLYMETSKQYKFPPFR